MTNDEQEPNDTRLLFRVGPYAGRCERVSGATVTCTLCYRLACAVRSWGGVRQAGLKAEGEYPAVQTN